MSRDREDTVERILAILAALEAPVPEPKRKEKRIVKTWRGLKKDQFLRLKVPIKLKGETGESVVAFPKNTLLWVRHVESDGAWMVIVHSYLYDVFKWENPEWQEYFEKGRKPRKGTSTIKDLESAQIRLDRGERVPVDAPF